jgi:hypothetical protein
MKQFRWRVLVSRPAKGAENAEHGFLHDVGSQMAISLSLLFGAMPDEFIDEPLVDARRGQA